MQSKANCMVYKLYLNKAAKSKKVKLHLVNVILSKGSVSSLWFELQYQTYPVCPLWQWS